MAVTRRRPVAARPRNLLLEIGTEELPPKSLKSLGECFAGAVHEALNEAGVGPEGGDSCRWYATPRRLAVWVGKVKPRQPDRIEERRGPSIRAAFDGHGMPTPAALGFARSCGVGVDKLGRQVTDQGEWLLFRRKVAGERIRDIVEQALEQAIRRLPIARRMRWGNGTEEFVRPVHWLLAMYGSEALKVSALGLKAGKWTYGHRFHSRGEIRIMSADRYLDTLKKQGLVIADYGERQQLIVRQVTRLARRNGGTAVLEPVLLDEVTGLVEWPQALYGEFDRRFLKVPPEVLVSSMQDHQKYFHLEDGRGRLLPGFITVSNVRSRSPKRVRSGNERVLRARLADAEFFWLSDQKQPLESRRGALDRVLFHERLGSIGAKVERIRALALEIAGQVGANAEQVARACDLCKADLVTDLVGEFPELQGIVGGYYAAAGGEDRAVSNAIREHYKPRFAGDGLPRGRVSRCLALADRVDSLAGIFACGEVPSGDRDPYALRRAALGILRIQIEERI
ncbi:MAG: glycine--tRNA ligase subunit beta, partial [Gammaproteobacteria bacterium]|nr:glycine--tRNA ligase subunit beta [Gammaproteobacteria bacterium]